ncbi:alpha-amylase family glycosyl hydrolase [Nitrosospira sp. NpAV]|uniref:alpha-amylase family glycosyl hydrolase n=1 Tax=Nitrosospira sp. NpAV TaxID=58133 RepID=UPI00059F7F15|nr:alpha-amylase family glycosyl hydrolase [Nitrosospira sp. NpAV]KIO49812.1 alpha-amylase [Nitrosospira sp. NpAV]
MKTKRYPRYPSLFQVNTRVYLSERAAELGRPAILDDIPDRVLEGWVLAGFDLIWFLGIWQTGFAGRQVSGSNPEWLKEYHRVLPDFRPVDICGSCFAIQDYRVHDEFGGDEALDRLRRRLHDHGLRLILDFVPNHTALDHPWVREYPDYYVRGGEEELAAEPYNYRRMETAKGERILAYGRDPYFAGWPDTLQLNYGNPVLREAMDAELRKIAIRCDGVRCDMAMLVLPEVFERTWGIPVAPFWPQVTKTIHDEMPGFLFLAEVYWDLESALQQQGFDYTYDKRLYDRLHERHVRPIREHFLADLNFQDKLVRFLENHDEPRAAAAFSPKTHRPAAIITFLAPGLRFFHQGQFEGRKIRIPVHLRRGPAEPVDHTVAEFYTALIECLRDPVFREGNWRLLECCPAWDGNWTSACFIAYSWTGEDGGKRLIAINYSDHQSQCYVVMPWAGLEGQAWQLYDRMGTAIYERNGDGLAAQGLYLDVPAWAYHVFDVYRAEA